MEYLDQTLNQPPGPLPPPPAHIPFPGGWCLHSGLPLPVPNPKRRKIQREVTGEIKTKETGKLLIAEKVKFMNKKGAI